MNADVAISQAQQRSGNAVYYPGPDGRWEHRSPRQAGMNSAGVAAAAAFAITNESKAPRELLLAHVQSFGHRTRVLAAID